MPRIIVVTDLRKDEVRPAVLLDEAVSSVHLSTEHASAQLVERLAWAVKDAEFQEDGREHVHGLVAEHQPSRTTSAAGRQPRPLAA